VCARHNSTGSKNCASTPYAPWSRSSTRQNVCVRST
jgi:hypothetical protein